MAEANPVQVTAVFTDVNPARFGAVNIAAVVIWHSNALDSGAIGFQQVNPPVPPLELRSFVDS